MGGWYVCAVRDHQYNVKYYFIECSDCEEEFKVGKYSDARKWIEMFRHCPFCGKIKVGELCDEP